MKLSTLKFSSKKNKSIIPDYLHMKWEYHAHTHKTNGIYQKLLSKKNVQSCVLINKKN